MDTHKYASDCKQTLCPGEGAHRALRKRVTCEQKGWRLSQLPRYLPLLPRELELSFWVSSGDLETFHTGCSVVIGSSLVGYGALVGLDIGCFTWETSSNFAKEKTHTYIPTFFSWGQVNGGFWSFSHKK